MTNTTLKLDRSMRGSISRASHLLRLLAADRIGISGASAVEFAIVAPLILFIAVATIDIGTGFYYRMRVEDAAQAGAQYAMVHGFNTDAIVNIVKAATGLANVSASPAPVKFCGCPSGTGVTTVDCNGSCSAGGGLGLYAAVSAQATYQTLLTYPFLPSTYDLTSIATVRLQ